MVEKPKIRVGLFATCLVDLYRPSVAFAAVKLLETAGCVVDAPLQSCCGQPAYNAGDRADARALALQTIKAFEGFDYIVAPSGSCAATMARHYPKLFADDPHLKRRADLFSDRVYELTAFLTDVLGVESVDARFEAGVAYHDSCSGLRELGIKDQPRKLLKSVRGLELKEIADGESCCGFGGLFAIKYGEISGQIVTRKVEAVEAAKPDVVAAGDLGCLMNIAGRLHRMGSSIEARHVAEILADMTDAPAIGAPAQAKTIVAPSRSKTIGVRENTQMQEGGPK